MVPQNQLVNTHYPNDLPTVTCRPANVNRCIPPFKKTQVSSDPVLLISPVPHLCNITLTLLMLNPSSKDSTSSNLLYRKLTLKLAPSKQNRCPANTHYLPSSNSTIIIPKSDTYRPCQLLLSKKACWMFALMLTIVTILTTVASHTHCHFNHPFKKQNKPLVSPESNLTWKEILTYGTTVCLKIRLQPTRPEKTSQLYFLDWTLPPVLAKRLHISNHFALGVYDPIFPKNSSLIQTVTHASCHLAMNASEQTNRYKRTNEH